MKYRLHIDCILITHRRSPSGSERHREHLGCTCHPPAAYAMQSLSGDRLYDLLLSAAISYYQFLSVTMSYYLPPGIALTNPEAKGKLRLGALLSSRAHLPLIVTDGKRSYRRIMPRAHPSSSVKLAVKKASLPKSDEHWPAAAPASAVGCSSSSSHLARPGGRSRSCGTQCVGRMYPHEIRTYFRMYRYKSRTHFRMYPYVVSV